MSSTENTDKAPEEVKSEETAQVCSAVASWAYFFPRLHICHNPGTDLALAFLGAPSFKRRRHRVLTALPPHLQPPGLVTASNGSLLHETSDRVNRNANTMLGMY